MYTPGLVHLHNTCFISSFRTTVDQFEETHDFNWQQVLSFIPQECSTILKTIFSNYHILPMFYLFNAIWLQGLKARFRFRTHCTVILRRLELLTKYSGSEHKKKGLKSLLMIFFMNSCKKKCQILNQCRSLITLCQLGKLVSTWVNLVQFASTWVSLGQLG